MERLTVMKSFNRGLPPLTPPLRDVSFSAYLPPDDLNYAPKKESPPAAAAAAMADDSEISIFDAQKYFNECSTDQHQHKESTRVAPVGPEQHCEPRPVTTEGYGRNYSARSFHATPTVSSEASWNSQTGLLRNPPGSVGVNMRMRSVSSEHGSVNVTGRKWFFRRKCPCSGKKDVEIKEKVSEQQPNRSPSTIGGSKKVTDKLKTNNPQKVVKKSAKSLDSPDWALPADRPDDHDRDLIPQFPPEYRSTQLAHRVLASGPGFSFPILSQPPPVKMVFTAVRHPIPMEDPRRDSLEIFRPSAAAADIIPPLRIFAPNPPDRRSFTFSASPKSRCAAAMDDDVASDASSDLFEIESFTTQTTTTTATATNYPMYHRRDSLDEASRRYCYEPPTEGYEPSEASIDWSVTTAEGFDRGSVTNFSVSASDIVDDVTLMRHELQRLGNGGGFDDNGGGRRRGNGMLMSCRCEKAVSVGPTPTPVKEGQAGTYKHVSSRDRMIGVGKNKPPLPRSHSARLSLTFAT